MDYLNRVLSSTAYPISAAVATFEVHVSRFAEMARSTARLRISLRDNATSTNLKVELIEAPGPFGERRYRLHVNNRAPHQFTEATLTEIFDRLRRWLVRRA